MDERLNGEDIAAYMDGEMSDAEAQEFETTLQSDPFARAEVQRLQEVNSLLKGAYNEILDEPVPLAVAGRVQRALASVEPGPHASPVPAGGAWRAWGLQAIAASLLAVILSFPAGFFTSEWRQEAVKAEVAAAQAADREAMAVALSEALEKRLSGVAVDWHNQASGSSGAVTPVRTFRNADGRWCREYLEEASIGGTLDSRRAIACRESDGQWRTRILALSES